MADEEAFRAVLVAYPGHVRRHGNRKMVYNPTRGTWSTNVLGVFISLCQQVHGYTRYGSVSAYVKRLYSLIRTLPDDTEFFETAKQSSLDKSLWKDCIWDYDNQVSLEFTPDIYFDRSTDRPFPLYMDQDRIDRMNRHFFEEPGFGDDYKDALRLALSGRNPNGVMLFDICPPPFNGKSVRALVLHESFNMGDRLMCYSHVRTINKYLSTSTITPMFFGNRMSTTTRGCVHKNFQIFESNVEFCNDRSIGEWMLDNKDALVNILLVR